MSRASLFLWETSCNLCLRLQFLSRPADQLRTGCGHEGVGERVYTLSLLGCDTLVLLLFRSRIISVLLSNFIFFVFGPHLESSVVGTSSGCVVMPSAGTASSLSSPSALPTSVAVSCLAPSCCVFARSCRAVCLICLSSGAVISASTTIRCEWSIPVAPSEGGVLVLGLQ